jgi:hypothetical protein
MQIMELEEIQRKVEAGQYAVRPHAVIHAVKEGFTEADMVYVVRHGKIIEEYPERYRCLVYAEVPLSARTSLPLHVICDYWDAEEIHFVTAYVPDSEFGETPVTRRK